MPLRLFPATGDFDNGQKCTGWTEFFNPNIGAAAGLLLLSLTGDAPAREPPAA